MPAQMEEVMACTIKPEDIKRVKGLGFLNNKGTDLFNGRVITGIIQIYGVKYL